MKWEHPRGELKADSGRGEWTQASEWMGPKASSEVSNPGFCSRYVASSHIQTMRKQSPSVNLTRTFVIKKETRTVIMVYACCCLVTKSCPTPLWPLKVPLSMGFPRQEYWSGLPFPSPGGLPNPGTQPASPALQADSLPEPLGKPHSTCCSVSI